MTRNSASACTPPRPCACSCRTCRTSAAAWGRSPPSTTGATTAGRREAVREQPRAKQRPFGDAVNPSVGDPGSALFGLAPDGFGGGGDRLLIAEVAAAAGLQLR